MLQSTLFTKTRREAPKDEVSKNARLLVRAGFVHKEMAGVYTYLPLGLRVLNKIENIIREEMNVLGAQEALLTTLQNKSIWEKTGRFDDKVVDDWFKTKLKNGTELGLGFTHEEPLTNLLKDHVNSYRDLPLYIYQIQTKFRNEMRAKSGLIRCREFSMKDLYSFSKNEKEHDSFYERVQDAYKNIFRRLGIDDRTYMTFATGGTFSKYSHEFQTVSLAGEDTIYVDEEKKIAVNKEVLSDDVTDELGLKKDKLVEKKSIEVGNIFGLGTRFSDAFDLEYIDEKGGKKKVIMGSYGLGPTRLMGTLAEVLSDDKGLVWPQTVSPFKVHLLALTEADEIYKKLMKAGAEVLYDDRSVQMGEKFADSDLIGIPYRAIVSERTAAGKVELVKRATGETKEISKDELIKIASQ